MQSANGEFTKKLDKKLKNLTPHTVKEAFKKSIDSSAATSWLLIRMYVPLSLLTIFLKQLGVLDYLAPIFAPFMELIGLPGESAIILVAGMLTNVFGALGAMSAFDLSFREITILGVVVGLAHNLIIETGVLMKLRIATMRIALFRITLALIVGFLLNAVMPGTLDGVVISPITGPANFSWITVIQNIVITSIQIIILLFILTLAYELALLLKFSEKVKQKAESVAGLFGFGGKAVVPVLVGFFTGIFYGAGILFQLEKKNKLGHKDGCLVTLFLCLAHGLIEDTMVFVLVGADFWWIFLTRLFLTIFIIKILSINNIYKKFLWIGLPKTK